MSVRSDKVSRYLIAATIVLIAVIIMSVFLAMSTPKVMVRLGDGVFRTTLAISPQEREQGLSGKSRLSSGEAMMLVYDSDKKWRIWMKDMNFPLDIVWLDRDRKVVYIVKNALPDSYPMKTFGPNSPARYVLEVPAGSVEDRGIRIGSYAEFDLSERLEIFE